MTNQDPTPELYKLMSEAGLEAANMLNSKKSMSKIVNEVRTELAMKLKSYIVRRDHEMFNAGRKEARKVEDEKTI